MGDEFVRRLFEAMFTSPQHLLTSAWFQWCSFFHHKFPTDRNQFCRMWNHKNQQSLLVSGWSHWFKMNLKGQPLWNRYKILEKCVRMEKWKSPPYIFVKEPAFWGIPPSGGKMNLENSTPVGSSVYEMYHEITVRSDPPKWWLLSPYVSLVTLVPQLVVSCCVPSRNCLGFSPVVAGGWRHSSS